MINITTSDINIDKLINLDLDAALQEACLLVERDAKIKCPVDTGMLRNSITSEVRDDEGYVGTNLEYAPYVENGTGLFASDGNGRKNVPWSFTDAEGKYWITTGQAPQPFLKPALTDNRQNIVKIFRKHIFK